MGAHSMRNDNQSLHDDQSRCDEIFLKSRPQMLTRDLFEVTNLLVFTVCRPKQSVEVALRVYFVIILFIIH